MAEAGAVLDSSAVLAVLREEPGAAAVEPLLPGAVLSVVNLAEVLAVLLRQGMPAAEASVAVELLGLRLEPADEALASSAAAIAGASRAQGLSLGDAFCLATAKALRLPAVTADRAWSRLKVGVVVKQIR